MNTIELQRPLTDFQSDLLEYCKGGRTSDAIVEHFGIKRNSAYYQLRQLLDLGLIRSEGAGGVGIRTKYLTTDFRLRLNQQIDDTIVDGRIIQFAHDPFNLSGRRVIA